MCPSHRRHYRLAHYRQVATPLQGCRDKNRPVVHDNGWRWRTAILPKRALSRRRRRRTAPYPPKSLHPTPAITQQLFQLFQGIRTPVLLDEQQQQTIGRSRLGLGARADDTAKFRTTVRSFLEDFVKGYDRDEIVFSEELTKEERMIVHRDATRLGLNTKSFDVPAGRRLRVYRRRSAAALLAAAICGEDGRYEVTAPTTGATRVDQRT